jgi:hypothetical protein
MKKWIIPAGLALAVLGVDAAPAMARHRNGRPHYRVQGSRQHLRSNWGPRRQQVADRAARLYQSGRLSRDHYDRTLAKLDQDGGPGWVEQVDDTLTEWSRSTRRRR